MSDHLSAAAVRAFLKTPAAVFVSEETVSTNDDAKALAQSGFAGNAVILAERQSGGRGRKGRSFFSPDATGLYLSILTRPALSAEETLSLTTMAAVAAARAIETVSGAEIGIKWVNDLLKNGKKLCGILTEAAFTAGGGIEYAVVGIGINVLPPQGGFPQDISGIAGSVFESESEAPADVRNRLAAEIANNFFRLYEALPDRSYKEDYIARSAVTGRRVTVSKNGKEALAVAVNDDLSLLVRYDDGTEEALNSGEVSVRIR